MEISIFGSLLALLGFTARVLVGWTNMSSLVVGILVGMVLSASLELPYPLPWVSLASLFVGWSVASLIIYLEGTRKTH